MDRSVGISARWPVVLLSFLLFYFPSVLSILGSGDEPREWIAFSLLMSTFYAGVFCVNYFWLVPSIIIHNDRKVLYFLINFCLIVGVCGFVPLIIESVVGLPHHMRDYGAARTWYSFLVGYIRFVIRDGTMMILSAALAFALRLSGEREDMRRRELELQGERRQIELKSLKAQLNPHFLFNSLNNIYALIGFAPGRAQQALHELSGMLRFMIYDSGTPYVPLEKELHFIASYIELMKLRLSPSVSLKCVIPDVGGGKCRIAPLLLLTLVENAFKHSAPACGGHFIDISISLDRCTLACRVRNSFDGGKSETTRGVGLDNVRKQLGLIYPDRHSFMTKAEDTVFDAALTLELS